MITRSGLFSCLRSVPSMFRLLAPAIITIAAAGFAAAQEPPPTADQRGAVTGLPHPSDLAFRRWKYFHEPRAYPFGRIPPGAYQAALRDYNQKWGPVERQAAPEPAPVAAAITTTAWKPIGPAPIRSLDPPVSGRINAIAIHPNDPKIIYIGAAEGGVWKTVDGGASWVPLTDGQYSLAMGAIAIDPVNPNIVYAGTGEENFSYDSYSGCGILRSTDAGATWTQFGASTFVNPSGGGATISRIVIDPATAGSATTTKVYVASSIGVYRSISSGFRWSPVLVSGVGSSCLLNPTGVVPATDLVIDPKTPANVYAALGNPCGGGDFDNGVWKSPNNGASGSWSEVLPLGGTGAGRINVAISRSAPATLYASVQRAGSNDLLGILMTTNGGSNWKQLAATDTDCGKQCFYDMYLAVDPTKANVVYFGGFSIYKSTDGGASFADIGGPIHVDHHAFAFNPVNHNIIYTGSDGGIFSSVDGGGTWSSLNTNLALTQFSPGVSLHPTNTSIAMGGTQDNGTVFSPAANAWAQIFDDDGGFTAIDFAAPTTGYTEPEWLGDPTKFQFAGPYRTDSLGTSPSWAWKLDIINLNDRGLFIPPLVMSPTNSRTLYFGTYRLYRTTDRGDSWTVVNKTPSDLTKGAGFISAIAQAKSNPSIIYVGTSDANVQITKDGGSTWKQITTGLPSRWVTYVAVSPSDAATAFVTVSGFGSGHVFKTTNSGGVWSDITGNLPNIPVNTILLDPGAPTAIIYVGTDLGVFRTTNGGVTWAPFNRGLPKVAVLHLAFNQKTGVLVAATHGRSAWKIAAPNSPVISVAPPTRDYGSILHGTTANVLVTVTNIGQGTLTGSAALGGSGAFSIVSGGTFNLGAGASQTVTVRFGPSTVGRFDTDLKFSSNGGVAEAVLSGAGK